MKYGPPGEKNFKLSKLRLPIEDDLWNIYISDPIDLSNKLLEMSKYAFNPQGREPVKNVQFAYKRTYYMLEQRLK